MRENLKDSRFRHSLGVETMAVKLAAIWGADTEKAGFAGRYHDIAKNFDTERMDDCIRRYGLSEDLKGDNALAHSKVAAAILENEFGVDDKDILNAVRYHTTGRRDMSLLEEIIFVADAVEDNRTYNDLKYYQKLAETDLDRACFEIIEYTIWFLESKERKIHKDTIEARDWAKERIKGDN